MDRQKILVVDDENRMRKLVKDFLQRENFEVLEAGDGSEALDVFFAHQDIALMILDVMMPKMDGWEVVKTIRKYSQVPIIMLTARARRATSCRALIWAWMSIFPNRSVRRSWSHVWRRSCAAATAAARM